MHLVFETSAGFYLKFFTFVSLAILTWIYYRITFPKLRKMHKIFLFSLRFSAFSLLFFLLYQMTIHLYFQKVEKNILPIYIDNSASMMHHHTQNDLQKYIQDITKSIQENPSIKTQFYLFGDSLRAVSRTERITFQDRTTQMRSIIDHLVSLTPPPVSALIISDGQWNSGVSPENLLHKADLPPLYCIGIGDSSSFDYRLTNVQIEDNFFQNKPNFISVKMTRNFFGKDSVKISLEVDGRPVMIKNLYWKKNELTKEEKIKFIPEKVGKINLTFQLESSRKEGNIRNNVIQKDYNIFKSQYNLLIMGGIPNPDVKKLKQFAEEIPLINPMIVYDLLKNNPPIPPDIDALVLWGFPGKRSEESSIRNIINILNKNKLPIWINITKDTDITKLKKIIDIKSITNNPGILQLESIVTIAKMNLYNSPFAEKTKNLQFWETVPPVQTMVNILSPSNLDQIILWGKNQSKQFPMMIKQKNKNSIVWISSISDIWRWHSRLVMEDRFQNGLKKFLENIYFSLVLNERNNSRNRIRFESTSSIRVPLKEVTTKVIVYDNNLAMMDQAHVHFSIERNGELIFLQNKYGHQDESGYAFTYNYPKPGNYQLTAKIFRDSIFIAEKTEEVVVNNINLEEETLSMNAGMLSQMAEKTGGLFYAEGMVLSEIQKPFNNLRMTKRYRSISIMLKDNAYVIVLLILLLNLEWFFRKRWGLL